jgi:hypothetical protein
MIAFLFVKQRPNSIIYLFVDTQPVEDLLLCHNYNAQVLLLYHIIAHFYANFKF